MKKEGNKQKFIMSLRKHEDSGFTIVELVIVVVVIIVLSLLVLNTYSSIQAKTRNNKRQADITAIRSQLEAFFQQNGYYPSYKDLSSASWVNSHMKLNVSTMIDPSSNSKTATLVKSASSISGKFAYYPTDSSGSNSSCESQDSTCALYTLSAKYEGTYNGQVADIVKNLD